MLLRVEDFKLFCEETGRDSAQYSNIPVFLKFAEWVIASADKRLSTALSELDLFKRRLANSEEARDLLSEALRKTLEL